MRSRSVDQNSPVRIDSQPSPKEKVAFVMSTQSLRPASDRFALTSAQRRLLRNALDGGSERKSARARREVMRELCRDFRAQGQAPEQLLIAFKASLVEAANEAQIPYGPEGSELISQLVTVFI